MLRSLSLVLVVSLASACSSVDVARAPADAAADDDAAATPVAHAPVPTMLGDALGAAGLDPATLPPLAMLDAGQRDAVMQTFTRALGLACGDCHEADYAVPTRRTRIAGKMWDVMTRGLRFTDGNGLYCDSCHQGAATFLDRRDRSPTGELAGWMRAAYVTPFARSDGGRHDCASCHGMPFAGRFLDGWGAGPPDLGGPDGGDGNGGGGGNGNGNGGGGPDMARLGCGRLLACIDACGTNTRCAGNCKAHAPVAAKQLLQAADDCALAACMKDQRCKNASDDSDDCNRCFGNASSGGVTGVACVPAGDPDCGACAVAWLACETN